MPPPHHPRPHWSRPRLEDHGIHGDMMLPTGDPLVPCRNHARHPLRVVLTVWLSILPALGVGCHGSLPDSTSEGIIDGLPSSVSFPRRKVVVDGPPWGENRGATLSRYSHCGCGEDGINHGPHLGLAWPPTGAGRRQEGLQDSPLLACQITGVWLRVHTLSQSVPDPPFGNRLLDRVCSADDSRMRR